MTVQNEVQEPEPPLLSPASTAAPTAGLERAWRLSLIVAGGLALALGLLVLVWLFARPLALVLIALLLGSTVGGMLGAIVAIPLASALRVLVVRVIAPAVRRWSGAPASDT